MAALTFDYSGFAFIFSGLVPQIMVMNFFTKHVTFGGICHQKLARQYSLVIWSTLLDCQGSSMNATFFKSTSTFG
jgi:hypothetical protein